MPALKPLLHPPEIPIAVGNLSVFRYADQSAMGRQVLMAPILYDWGRIAATESTQTLWAG